MMASRSLRAWSWGKGTPRAWTMAVWKVAKEEKPPERARGVLIAAAQHACHHWAARPVRKKVPM